MVSSSGLFDSSIAKNVGRLRTEAVKMKLAKDTGLVFLLAMTTFVGSSKLRLKLAPLVTPDEQNEAD